jgi:hypothetical protein
VHSFGPNSRPEHLQLYFYDGDPTLIHRKEATKDLDQQVVRKVVEILRGNPYSEQFRSLGTYKDNLQDYRIELNTDKKLDQRRYNLPVSSEVAAIWVEGSDLANRFKRSITLYGDNNERHSIQATQGCYDPLSYPLFFPKGELGWHPNIPKRDTPWHVAQLSREDRDDGGLDVQRYLCIFLSILLVFCLTFFYTFLTQMEMSIYVSPSETTTVTDYRHVPIYSTRYYMVGVCSNSLRSTCT